MEIKGKRTIEDVFNEWKKGVSQKGWKAFWPSFIAGTYISEKNQKARAALQRLKERVYPDVKKKVVRRHGKNILVEYDRKLITKSQKYFNDDNSLQAIARMLMAGTRPMRRNLCRRLGLRWKTEYLEAEKMIMESDNFNFEGILKSRGVK